MIKTLFVVLILLSSTFYTHALELSKEAIKGKWLIVQIGDLKTKDLGIGVDIWEFTDKQWFATTGHKTLKPEPYIVKANEIVVGKAPYSYPVKVTEFSKNRMVTDANGIVQILERMEK